MVLADSRGISRVPRYSGACPASQSTVVYRAVTVCGRSFQIVRLVDWLVTRRPCGQTGPTTPVCKHTGPSNTQSQIPYPNTRQFHAHCVCVVGKTTVCRIFSCQRSLRGKYRPAESFGDRGALSPGPPSLARSWGPNAPLRSLASITRVRPEPRLRSLAGTPSPRFASSQLAHLRSLATSQHSFVAEPKSFKDRRIRGPGAGG